MQLILDVEEPLEELMLLFFADLVLLSPAGVQFFVKGIDLVVLLRQ